jgi:hypothetical protein
LEAEEVRADVSAMFHPDLHFLNEERF